MKIPYKPALNHIAGNCGRHRHSGIRQDYNRPRTKRFEDEFSSYCEVRHAVTVNSCTAAPAVDCQPGSLVSTGAGICSAGRWLAFSESCVGVPVDASGLQCRILPAIDSAILSGGDKKTAGFVKIVLFRC